MADIRCPMCSKPNPEELDTCRFCGARLKPVEAPPPAEQTSIRPGEEPVKKNTSEFEKVNLPPAGKEPIRPGEAPTKKNTAELERALPSWLRSLRGKQDTPPAGTPPEPPAKENPPAPAVPPPAPEPAGDNSLDWLSGLGAAAAKEEQVPDWLANLRGKGESEGNLAADSGAGFGEGDTSWMSRLGEVSNPPASGTPSPPQAAPGEGLPDWIQGLQSGPATAPEKPTAGQQTGDEVSDWLSHLPNIPAEEQAAPHETTPSEELPDWLDKLKGSAGEPEPAQPAEPPAASTPDWLASLQAQPEQGTATPAEAATQRLDKLEGNGPEPETAKLAEPPAGASDWLARFRAEPEEKPAAPSEELPDWLSKLEATAGTDTSAPMPPAFSDQPAFPSGESGGGSPDWLSKLEGETANEKFEAAPEPPPQIPPESLPEWLSSAEQPESSAAETQPPVPGKEENKAAGGKAETVFSVETPDWLSELKPEPGAEKKPEGSGEEERPPESLQPADLPSWVQAMRPVEAVVAEAKSTPQEENQVTEDHGPLAGLQGVLPAGPGLGPLRKPPAYSVKLQATDSQQRYAAHLEKIIAAETESHTAQTARPFAGGLLRGVIALLLILTALLPILIGKQINQTFDFYPSEIPATFTLIETLPANAPVLVAYDYEPALSGELEAAAAPVIEHLLVKQARLTFISTSPTGPALAERSFQKIASGLNYQSGQQYVNLGYLAGGPTGVLYFATNPAEAAPISVDGTSAWQLPPLQGVKAFSDFGAVIILVDNADTARNWIEQTSQSLGNTPMVMVISAQAEPMVRPYFDSGQIKGLVAGLAGGQFYQQAYSQIKGQTLTPAGPGQNYWASFSLGMFVAEIVILVGCLWSVLTRRRPGQTKSGEEA